MKKLDFKINQIYSVKRKKKYSDALRIIDSIEENSITAELCVVKSMCIQLSDISKYELKDAKQTLMLGMALDKNNFDIYIELGYYAFVIDDDDDKAESYFNTAHDLVLEQLVNVLVAKANCIQRKSNDLEKAVEFIQNYQIPEEIRESACTEFYDV